MAKTDFCEYFGFSFQEVCNLIPNPTSWTHLRIGKIWLRNLVTVCAYLDYGYPYNYIKYRSKNILPSSSESLPHYQLPSQTLIENVSTTRPLLYALLNDDVDYVHHEQLHIGHIKEIINMPYVFHNYLFELGLLEDTTGNWRPITIFINHIIKDEIPVSYTHLTLPTIYSV